MSPAPNEPVCGQHRRPLADVELPPSHCPSVSQSRSLSQAWPVSGRPVVTRLLRQTVARALAVDVAPEISRGPDPMQVPRWAVPIGSVCGASRSHAPQPGSAERSGEGVEHAAPCPGTGCRTRTPGPDAGRRRRRRAATHAAGTIRARRRLQRPGALRALLAPELAVRVLPVDVRDVVLEGAVVEHVGLRLARQSPLQSIVPLPVPVCWRQTAPKLGTGIGGIVILETATRPSWSKFAPEDGQIDLARAGRRVARSAP